MDDVLPPLTATEVRVLGSLIEKQITTPDYYPLTLNALTNACNQLSNRDPVVAFDENDVVRAIDGLRGKKLASQFTGQESRVAKYKQTLTEVLLLTPAEVALLTILMLRGPQTVGELRTRAERMFKFDSLPEVEETLDGLATRQPQSLVAKLPRQPGTKESRYVHLLSGPVPTMATEVEVKPAPVAPLVHPDDARVAKLEQEIARLSSELTGLKQEFADFRKQLE